MNYTFCDGYREAFHLTGSTSDRLFEGMVFSPNNDTGSLRKTGVSKACEVNIATDIKGHHDNLITLELLWESNDINNDLCLLEMISGNRMHVVDGDCQGAKVQSGPKGITLKLNEHSRLVFHIKYKGRSLKCFLNKSGKL